MPAILRVSDKSKEPNSVRSHLVVRVRMQPAQQEEHNNGRLNLFQPWLEADNQSACDVVQHSDNDVLKRQLLDVCAESLERLCHRSCMSGGGTLDSLQTHPTW